MRITVAQMAELADRHLISKLGYGIDINELCLWLDAPQGSVNEHLSQPSVRLRETPIDANLKINGSLVSLTFENHAPRYLIQSFNDKTELKHDITHGPFSILGADISFVIVFEYGKVKDYEIECQNTDGRDFVLTPEQLESGFNILKQGELLKNGVKLHWIAA